jgi:hypothetical protein
MAPLVALDMVIPVLVGLALVVVDMDMDLWIRLPVV